MQGRDDDALVVTGRAGAPVALLPLARTTLMEDETGVFHFQLRQRGPRTRALHLELARRDATAAAARSGA